MSQFPQRVTEIETRPFVEVLTAVRDAGRQRRNAGASDDDPQVRLGKRAHAALMWCQADFDGDIERAEWWLDEVYERPHGFPPGQ